MDAGQVEKQVTPNSSRSVGRRSFEAGFTFIEIVIAVTLLAAGASILIGLQGAIVKRSLYDRNVQQAMLAARRIMAVIESTEPKLEVAEQNDTPVLDLLRQLNVPEIASESERQPLAPLRATIKLEDWPLPIPGVEKSAIQKLTLTVSWSPDPGDSFSITYFPPARESEDDV